MQLFNFFNSSTSYRVRIALALKGLDYRYIPVNIRSGEQAGAAHIALNPSKGVPVLCEDDGFALSQSLAIIEYLDERFPQAPLLPADVREKARVRAFAAAIACDIHPINNLRVLAYLDKVLAVTPEQKQAWYKHWVAEGLTAAETVLQGRAETPFCFGDTPTLADICLVPQIANAERFGCDLSPYPRLMRIYRHCLTHPAFAAAAPQQQPDFIP